MKRKSAEEAARALAAERAGSVTAFLVEFGAAARAVAERHLADLTRSALQAREDVPGSK